MRLVGRREFHMWKKTVPLVVLSGVLLVGCNNNDTVPNKNETPMNDVQEDVERSKDNIERDIDNGNTHGWEDNIHDDKMNDGKMNNGQDGSQTDGMEDNIDDNG